MDVVTLAAAKAASEPLTPPRLYKPTGLRRWRAALADAKYTVANVNVVGDSISLGAYANNVFTSDETTWASRGWAGQLRSLLQAQYGDAGEGYLKADTENARCAVSGGSVSGVIGPMQKGRQIAAGNTITFTLVDATDIDIMAWWTTGAGQFTYTVDGGGAVTSPASSGSDTLYKVPITGLSAGTHTIVITGPASGNSWIAGLIAKKTPANGGGVRLHRIARSGATTDMPIFASGGVITNAAHSARILNSTFSQLGPANLAIISFGANDVATQGATGITPTIFRASLKVLTDKVTAVGGCTLLMAGPRYPGASSPFTEQQFYDQMKNLAMTDDHVSFIDLAEVWGTEAQAEQLGYMNNATYGIHPLRQGHGDISRMLWNALIGHRGVVHA